MVVETTLTFAKLTALAFANSVNPCQIAMLVLVLMTIVSGNVEHRRKILFSGMAFISAVFIGYLIYGIILVKLFSFTIAIRQSSFYLRQFMILFAMIIGALQIKDFFMYKPGSFMTEMPIFLRPKVKKIINKITSPFGAFITGFLVTLFLAPCTMAPLLVATEALSQLGIVKALPWLMYFNFIVVIPLIVITFVIYFGLTRAEDVAGWKDKNVRYLHLIAGILLFLVGLSLLLGWI